MYIAPQALHGPINTASPKIHVGTSNGQVVSSSEIATLPIPQQGHDKPCEGHIMPTFINTLLGIVLICNTGCTVTFTSKGLEVYSARGLPILTGWRETHKQKIWRFTLSPKEDPTTLATPINERTSLCTYMAYALPSVVALVRYLHVAAGFPTKAHLAECDQIRKL